jgi:hypothetical protein
LAFLRRLENKSDEMNDDYNHALKSRRPGVRASERTLPMSAPGLRLGPAETYAKQETEREIAARLAALEALDPLQTRPTPKPNILNRVSFIEL